MKYVLPLAAFLTVSCAGTGVQDIPERPGHYRLHYCAKEADCFEAAKKHCDPRGYRITKYGNIRPEQFVCEDK